MDDLGGGMANNEYGAWVGRELTLTDTLTDAPARALAATLNNADSSSVSDGREIQALWNWLYFLTPAPTDQLGVDGHPHRGGFLPPVDLPRRMWAGSRCVFHTPLHIGDKLAKTSTIVKVSEKTGRTGTMVFVTVRHVIRCGDQIALEEEQDIVYLAIPEKFSPPEATPLPPCDWQVDQAVDPVFLFRFSALTFNGHRIHYDRTYAMEVEKYPGLVIHGPLQAILLFDAACRRNPDKRPATYSFRGLRPLFDFDTVTLNGRTSPEGGLDLYTANGDGAVGVQAALTWATK
jgi:3-methylfumaryl-CoA hydratase